MNELDLDDIESHLYSQVYHSTDTTSDQIVPPQEPLTIVNDMKKPGRYFGPWSPKRNVPPKQTIFKDIDQSQGFYSKNCTRRQKPDISINQLVVFSPQSPIVCLTPQQKRKMRWKAKKRQKKAAKMLNKEVKVKETESVITLSDSDDDSCVVIPENWPTLSVNDSDDEKNKKEGGLNEGDVVFVESVEKAVEVINLEEDFESPEKATESRQKTLSSSETPGIELEKNHSPKQVHQERKELLSTPDSASNDFVNTSGIELSQRNFNFSLHGSDFNNSEFVKPSNRETCETETSSSTTDVNSVNLMKTAVFNEIEFPKDDFSVESFGNSITPIKNTATVSIVQSTPIQKNDVPTPNYSSDSSSESDFEDPQIEKVKSKNLPELSPIQTKKASVSVKKIKSKYDLVEPEVEVKKQKKKNKNKKKNDNVELKKKRKSSQMDDESETASKKKLKTKKNKANLMPEMSVTDSNIQNDDSAVAELEKNNDNQDKKASELDKSRKPPDDHDKVVTEEKKDVPPSPSPLEGLVVVDETFGNTSDTQTVLSSDSESLLSPLNENQDIQLINCESSFDNENKKQNLTPVNTSKSNLNLTGCSVEDLQTTMSNDPKLWSILDSDRVPLGRSKSGRRCNKCKELGHMAIRCPNTITPKCRLCGDVGHYEPRCPNKMCSQCGRKSLYSTSYCNSCFKLRDVRCKLCSMTGHIASTCPDLWRRYYLTTTEGPLSTYNGPVLKQKHELWCCGCAQSGHLDYTCRYYKSVFPATDPFIKSYENIYDKRVENEQITEPNYYSQPNYLNQNYGYHNSDQFMNGLFVASQQNFFGNQFNQNNYMQAYPVCSNQYSSFNDNLPNFLSLNVQNASYEPQSDTYEPPNNVSERRRTTNSIFFNSSAQALQHFVNCELQKLAKMSYRLGRGVAELKKRRVPRGGEAEAEYYESINMILFGVFCMLDGKMHLDKLKQFRMERLNTRLKNAKRQKLHRAYCYIFGSRKHPGVNYNELLSRI